MNEGLKTIRVVAAIIQDGDRIFATQRGYGAYKDGWEFPGGKIELGETPEDALRREIMEELNHLLFSYIAKLQNIGFLAIFGLLRCSAP